MAGSEEALRSENERLRRRLEEIEAGLTAREGVGGRQHGGRQHGGESAWTSFEQLPFAVAVYSAEGDLRWANRWHGDLHGARGQGAAPPNLLRDPGAREGGLSSAFERALAGETVQLRPVPTSIEEPAAGQPDARSWFERIYAPLTDAVGAKHVLETVLDVSERMRRKWQLRFDSEMLRAILDQSPLFIYAKDAEGRYILGGREYLRWMRLDWETIRGKTDYDFYPKEAADAYGASDRETIATGKIMEREDTVDFGGKPQCFYTVKFPIHGSRGEIRGAISVSMDVTTYKRSEAEVRRLQEELIHVQEETLKALSTPLLPIARGVVVMPLIGNIDRPRAQRVLETMLEGVVKHQAGRVILDVTGVPAVDEETAASLIRTAQAVKLLGASVILTGIQPKIARTLIEIGTDLSGLTTQGTLEAAIAYALRH